MQPMPIRIFFIVFILILIYPSSLIAAAERRIALVIGNSAYSTGPLKTPVNDAAEMAATLKKLGFTVTLKKNVTLREMEDAVAEFGEKLKRGGAGLFFYAGHGLQISGTNYLVPIGANIEKESRVKYETMDADKVLDIMADAGNGLNIVILDACRDNPYILNIRDAARGLAIVRDAPVGTFISYSTDIGNVVQDAGARNSRYTEALVKYITEPGLTVEQVFKKVRAKLGKATSGKQVPWEFSSLQGEFYFTLDSSKTSPDVNGSGQQVTDRDELSASRTLAADVVDDESRKLEDELRKLEKEEKALLDRRQKIEEKKTALKAKKAMATAKTKEKTPSVPIAGELGRDGHFIAYGNGTVLDTQTKLMWAARDNGTNIDWQGAKRYCENYRGGGFRDWRMPTQDELAGLYDEGKIYNTACGYAAHLTELIVLSCPWSWASQTRGADAAGFHFGNGERPWTHKSIDNISRALPVRSGK
jgi:uncharacterized caspase-like protein